MWLVGLAKRWLNGAGRRATGWARSAFGAFVMESPVLMAFASAARVLDAPAEIKAPLMGATGITVCFWLGRHLPFLSGPGRRHARPSSAAANTSSR